MTKIYKSVAYAYPSSPAAKQLGMETDGCFYVQQTLIGIEGSDQCKTVIAHNCEGFESPRDPDLVAFFHETDGEIDPCFLEYGNVAAIDAILK